MQVDKVTHEGLLTMCHQDIADHNRSTVLQSNLLVIRTRAMEGPRAQLLIHSLRELIAQQELVPGSWSG